MISSSVAYSAAFSGVGTNIVPVDHNRALAVARAKDISHATLFATTIAGVAGDYDDQKGAIVVILAADLNRKPAESIPVLQERNVSVSVHPIASMAKKSNVEVGSSDLTCAFFV